MCAVISIDAAAGDEEHNAVLDMHPEVANVLAGATDVAERHVINRDDSHTTTALEVTRDVLCDHDYAYIGNVDQQYGNESNLHSRTPVDCRAECLQLVHSLSARIDRLVHGGLRTTTTIGNGTI